MDFNGLLFDKVFIFDGEMFLKFMMCRSFRIYLEMFINIFVVKLMWCYLNILKNKFVMKCKLGLFYWYEFLILYKFIIFIKKNIYFIDIFFWLMKWWINGGMILCWGVNWIGCRFLLFVCLCFDKFVCYW